MNRRKGLPVQCITLVSRDPEKDSIPVPADLREAEYQKIRGFYVEGFIRQIWLRGDVTGACMIFEASSVDEVVGKLNTLPLIQAGFLQRP